MIINSLGLSWLLDDPIKNCSAIDVVGFPGMRKKQNEWSEFYFGSI